MIHLKRHMKRKLINLAIGELASVVVFWLNFFVFKELIVTTKALISVSFSLLILSFILIQGAVFWCILIKRLSKPKFGEWCIGRIYNVLKKLDVVLLGIGILVIVATYSIAYVMILSFMIWLFAVIEWINYYKLQLSYDINPTVLFKYIRQRKLKKSKIAKEIEKAKKHSHD